MLASYKVDATRDSEPEQSFKLLRFEGENHIFALAQKVLRQNGLLTHAAQNNMLRSLHSLEHAKLSSLSALATAITIEPDQSVAATDVSIEDDALADNARPLSALTLMTTYLHWLKTTERTIRQAH